MARHSKEGWRRGQLESYMLMSKSQAALLRAYAVDRIHERDALVEAALAFVASAAESQSSTSSSNNNDNDNGYETKAVHELLEWRKRLGEETKTLDPGSMLDDRVREELAHLRKECRSQARKLDDMQRLVTEREDEGDALKSKLRKSEAQYAKLRDLLRDVREELGTRDQGGVVPKEDFERLWQKYDKAKAKIKELKAAAEPLSPGESREASSVPPQPHQESTSGPEQGRAQHRGACFWTSISHNKSIYRKGGNQSTCTKNAVSINSGSSSNGPSAVEAEDASISTVPTAAATAAAGSNGGVASAEGAATGSQEDNRRNEEGTNSENFDRTVNVEEVMEAQRLLRLELAEANERMEKARRGRKAAFKEKEVLVQAMAKELGDLERTKASEINAANREVKRLSALQEHSQRAVRDLAGRVEGEKAAFRGLAADVKNHLTALPEVATVAIGASRLSEVEGRMVKVREQYAREHGERRRLFNMVQELRGNIRVLCRCRPRTHHDNGGGVCVSFPGEGRIELVNERGKRKAWAFDQVVFGLEAGQETVYAEVSPLVVSVLDGYNACIFAYGQTGTGKTYTMMGPYGDRGVNARALGDLFTRSAARRGEVDDTITLSILEIYNEHIRDLLIESSSAAGADYQRKLEVRHGERGNFVPGLTTVAVSALDEVLKMLTLANKNRASACTNLNDHSSRSHLIMSVNVDGVNRHTGATSTGRLHLIDLAGSERISKSGAAGVALREAQNINKSLSALGDVISARASRQAHVPYRNSTLTYLLQDSLSADSKTLMLVCVSPVVQSAEESWCSLNFAARVRTVELGK
ncbi:unnamed protein product, partial [Pylaiella littoralis]